MLMKHPNRLFATGILSTMMFNTFLTYRPTVPAGAVLAMPLTRGLRIPRRLSQKLYSLIAAILFVSYQPVYGSGFCSPDEELSTLLEGHSRPTAIDFMKRRYGSERLEPQKIRNYITRVPLQAGSEFTEPTFGFQIKLVSDNVNQLNGERNHWNADGSVAFFVSGFRTVALFDGRKGDFLRNVDFSTQDIANVPSLDMVRWHPTDPNLLVYLDGRRLATKNIVTGQSRTLARFNVGTLGDGGRRIGGGDANDVAANRLLLSFNGAHKNIMIYDFDKNAIVKKTRVRDGSSYKVVTTFISPEAATSVTGFDFSSKLDYATLTNNGKFIIAQFHGGDTSLYSYYGEKIGVIYESSPHGVPAEYIRNGNRLQSYVTKQTKGPHKIHKRGTGDLSGFDLKVKFNNSTGRYDFKRRETRVLDWKGQFGGRGGGQFTASGFEAGIVAVALEPYNAAKYDKELKYGIYFDEIVTMSLGPEDKTPRRIAHHMNAWPNTATEQPEVWISPDGTKMFYKSNLKGLVDPKGKLFFVDIGAPTCPADRAALFGG